MNYFDADSYGKESMFPIESKSKREQLNIISRSINNMAQNMIIGIEDKLYSIQENVEKEIIGNNLKQIRDRLIKTKYILDSGDAIEYINSLIVNCINESQKISDTHVKNLLQIFKSFVEIAHMESNKLLIPNKLFYELLERIRENFFTLNKLVLKRKEINKSINELLGQNAEDSDSFVQALGDSNTLKFQIDEARKSLQALQKEQKHVEKIVNLAARDSIPTLENVIVEYQTIFHRFFAVTDENKQAYTALREETTNKDKDMQRSISDISDSNISLDNLLGELDDIDDSLSEMHERKESVPTLNAMLEDIKGLEKNKALVTTREESMLPMIDGKNWKGSLIELLSGAVSAVEREQEKEISSELMKLVRSSKITSLASFAKILRKQSPELVKYVEILVNNVIMADVDERKRNFSSMLVKLIRANDLQLKESEFQMFLTHFRYGEGTLKNYKGNHYFSIKTFANILHGLKQGGFNLDRLTYEEIEGVVAFYKDIRARLNKVTRADLNYEMMGILYALAAGNTHEIEALISRIQSSRYATEKMVYETRVTYFVAWKECIEDLVEHVKHGGLIGSFIQNMGSPIMYDYKDVEYADDYEESDYQQDEEIYYDWH